MLKSRAEAHTAYTKILAQAKKDKCVNATLSHLGRTDLFFLLTKILHRADADRDWLYDRCKEVYDKPNGYLDLWFREGYKSTIITFAKTIQDILNNSEITVGIFSHTKPIAKGFLTQIKIELEDNILLHELYPDILHQSPKKESTRWSLDSGIVVKRKSNPKEATVEAHGLVDGQPTSRHFSLLIYDDVVTLESVSTPEQIKKVTNAWAISLNLGSENGVKRYIGTRYHTNDTYKVMMSRGSVKPRIYPATDNGKEDGKPVFVSADKLAQKRKDMGQFVYAAQMLQDPTADSAQGFKIEWLKYWHGKKWGHLNLYIIVDPANAKKTTSDYTAMWVIGLGEDENYYVVDCIRDRLSLTERTTKLFELHKKYKPVAVGYEQYGMQADIEHIEYVQDKSNYRFIITPLGGRISKADRIKTLVPVFESARMYLPRSVHYINYEGRTVELIKDFVDDEYSTFPVCAHDDMLDDMARILDPALGAEFPDNNTQEQHDQQTADDNYNYWAA